MPDLSRPREVRLAEYLREYVRSRSSQTRKVSAYEKEGAVLWFKDVPRAEGVTSITQSVSVDLDGEASVATWLRVEQQDVARAPRPSAQLQPWLETADLEAQGRTVPPLKSRALLPTENGNGELLNVEVSLEDAPGIKVLYTDFSEKWRAWAESESASLQARDLYEKLFRIHTQMRREGEQVELRIGVGLLDWPNSNSHGAQVQRHVVTFSASLNFDARRGILTVEAPEDGVSVALEQDMFEVGDQPAKEHADTIAQGLEQLRSEDALWDRSRLDEVLKAWARILHPKSRWESGLEPHGGEDKIPTLSFAPALILRRRGAAAMIRVYDQIAEGLTKALGSGEGAPEGWTSLVEVRDDRVERRESGGGGGGGGGYESADGWPDRGDEIFFPLPANRDQMAIVKGVRERRGVLVQGPPGTGKSHTIANLMCHLLASGQRVLVTAENPRALSVLIDKIPEDLRALCISVLGQGGASFSDLNATIQKIGARENAWSAAGSAQRVRDIKSELGRTRERLDQVREDLRDLIYGEAVKHEPAPGYTGKPLELVTRVEQRRARYDWFRLPESAESTPPITCGELVDWYELSQREADFRTARADHDVPALEEIPSALRIEELFEGERRAKEALNLRGAEAKDPEVVRIARSLGERLEDFEQRVRAVYDGWEPFLATTWIADAARAFVSGADATLWQTRIERLGRIVEVLDGLEASLGEREIRLPDSRSREDLTKDATIVLEHLKAGGKWKKLFGVPKPIQGREYFRTEATVDGSPADEAFEFELILFELKRRRIVEEAREFLPREVTAGMASDGAGSSAPIRVALQQLKAVQAQAEADRTLRRELEREIASSIKGDWLVAEGARWVARWADAIAVRGVKRSDDALETIVTPLGRIQAGRQPHPAVGALFGAIVERDLRAYRQAYHELEDAAGLRDQFLRLQELDAVVRTAVPKLHAEITVEDASADWRGRLEDFEDAWAWAFTARWLQKFERPGAVNELQIELRSLVTTEGRLLEQLAAEYAWTRFFERLTPKESTALKSWRLSVSRMGKGTGRSAKLERLRSDARKHMSACRDAIPVWIMPRYLVAEMIEPSAERFDTVIVDEASQMGVNGLFVYFLGKRTIVVGDDQQISPADVGQNQATLARLINEFIPDIAERQLFDTGSSVYDHAKLRFQFHVTLREHFRCMPEIIQFSNDLCYAPNGTPLDPLRGIGADRLEPLKTEYVRGARREGKATARNEVEAEALVARLLECLDDPAYNDKTFGVISLQGPHQARLIESKLLSRLDPATYEERRILCGDSASFQGDERDVIFLSMVAAESEIRVSALTSQVYQQRFNVAASRARDQLWLFHSVQSVELKPECLRRRLIEFMRSPARAQADPANMQFDSPFEREVFDRIQQRGYRVVTQVPVGDGRTHSYRIDLVVEGLSGNKLAIECDGSAYHGPERFEADMERQRDLERVGWEFVRIPGSAFYRDRDAAMEPLWKELGARGIWPRGRSHDPVEEEVEPKPALELPATLPSQGWEEEPAVERRAVTSKAAAVEPKSESDELGDEHEDEHEHDDEDEFEHEFEHSVPKASQVTSVAPAPLFERRPEVFPTSPWRYEVVDLGASWVPSEEPKVTYDPREVRLSNVANRLTELVESLGPMPADSIFRHYRDRSPLQRRGRIVEEILHKALAKALREGKVLCEEEPGSEAYGGVLRAPGTPHVVIRISGDRRFEDIPPSEWAARIRKVIAARGTRVTDGLAYEVQRNVLRDAGFSATESRLEAMENAFRLAMDVRLPDGGTV